jgi:biotin carboxyl carrier protein
MQGKGNIIWLFFIVSSLMVSGCKNNTTSEENEIKASTPVTVTNISNEKLTEYIELNATSGFQKKNIVRSNATGFLSMVNINPGDNVSRGSVLFSLITKEASALKESKTISDSSFQFKGEIKISASQIGIVSSIAHQQGDYVQEGDELATIAEPFSLIFYMQVPYELAESIHVGQKCEILLPNEKQSEGAIVSILPSADLLSQAMTIVVKPKNAGLIPENIIARIRIAKIIKNEAYTLPKEAILTDETQSGFWVMKLINDTIAVKIPIQKGIEQDEKIEIIQPVFQKSDRIIYNGNYGLEDTARVNIVK